MKQTLTLDEEKVYGELKRLAAGEKRITGRQLRDAGFAKFVTTLYRKDVAYPESFQSRVLQSFAAFFSQ